MQRKRSCRTRPKRVEAAAKNATTGQLVLYSLRSNYKSVVGRSRLGETEKIKVTLFSSGYRRTGDPGGKPGEVAT